MTQDAPIVVDDSLTLRADLFRPQVRAGMPSCVSSTAIWRPRGPWPTW